jgi:PKD repeat protein
VLNFSMSASNGSGSYANYSWSIGSDPALAFGLTAAFGLPAAGTYNVTARVTDTNDYTADATLVLTISNLTALFSSRSQTVALGSVVPFTALASGGAGGPYNYTWQFGDGTVGFGASLNHTYRTAGTYSPTLIVRDRLGASSAIAAPKVTVSAKGGWFAGISLELLLGLVVALVAICAAVVYLRHRSRRAAGPAGAPLVEWSSQLRHQCPMCDEWSSPGRSTCQYCGSLLTPDARR